MDGRALETSLLVDAAFLEYALHESVRLRLTYAAPETGQRSALLRRAAAYTALAETLLDLFDGARRELGASHEHDAHVQSLLAWARLADTVYGAAHDPAEVVAPADVVEGLVRVAHVGALVPSLEGAADAALCCARALGEGAHSAAVRARLADALRGGSSEGLASEAAAAVDAIRSFFGSAEDASALVLGNHRRGAAGREWRDVRVRLAPGLLARFLAAHPTSGPRALCSRVLEQSAPATADGEAADEDATEGQSESGNDSHEHLPDAAVAESETQVWTASHGALVAAPDAPPAHETQVELPAALQAVVDECPTVAAAAFRDCLVDDDELARIFEGTHAGLAGGPHDGPQFETQAPLRVSDANSEVKVEAQPGGKRVVSESRRSSTDDSPAGSKRRRPVQWTEQEVANLVAGVERFGKHWRAILEAYEFDARRTNVDLKDKARNMNLC